MIASMLRGKLGLHRLCFVRADQAEADRCGADAAHGDEQKRALCVDQVDVEQR